MTPCRHCTARPVHRPRGLCWTCYYAPGVRDLYPVTSKYAKRAEATMCPVTARLALWSALVWAAETGRPSAWAPADWERFVRVLNPREILVIAFHGVRGMTFPEVGRWLGLSRGASESQWRSAMRKLKDALTLEAACTPNDC